MKHIRIFTKAEFLLVFLLVFLLGSCLLGLLVNWL